MPWSTPFDEPIGLRGGRQLRTLQDAADYIMKLAEPEQQEPRWQTAINVAYNHESSWTAIVNAHSSDRRGGTGK